uniref:NAD(P)/FAD-dependent oxidoreductase n=1 Tax=Ornithinicoccus halotolerans TaxID=1748220 RepID=UPI001885BBCE
MANEQTDRELRDDYDVVVVGGGAAGLSGALTLARARRSVLVVDAGQPRNTPAAGVHGLLGHDGIPPAELLARGRAEVRGYGGEVVTGQVVAAHREGDGFTVELAGGGVVRARRILLATGLVDELPDVPGLRQRWGQQVLHCPYCHGWEVRDRPIVVLGASAMSVHQALLFRQWSADLTYVTHTNAAPAAEQAEQLAARGIRVVEAEVAAVGTDGESLAGLRLADGSLLPCEAVAVAPRMVARADVVAGLGLTVVPHPSGMGEHVPADQTGRTDVPGIWAAGNVTDLSAAVGPAAAAGAVAAGQINMDLVMADLWERKSTDLSLRARRALPDVLRAF